MLYYELKKIWVKPGTKIAMIILVVLLFVVCWSAVRGVYWLDENSERVYGIEGIQKLKAAKKEWAGELTEEVIADVIRENARINETPEALSEDIDQKNIAYGWKQGFHDIRYLIMRSFCEFQEGDYYKPDRLKPEDAQYFYENRIQHLKDWLDEEYQQNMFSEDEREFLIERYEALETPLEYDYAEGWKQLFEFSAMITMIMMLVLGFLSASIFAGEFSYKADAIFYSSYHGRGRAVAAKLGAAILFITAVYAGMMFLYTVIVLAMLGTDGAGLAIQTNHDYGWKSFYMLTNMQEYQLIVIGGYIGTMFILLLTMLVSAMTRSTALAATIPFIVIFLPSFIGNSKYEMVGKILAVLPDRLLDIYQSVAYFYLYHIGGKVVGAMPIVFSLYAVLAVALCPPLYHIYRRKESK